MFAHVASFISLNVRQTHTKHKQPNTITHLCDNTAYVCKKIREKGLVFCGSPLNHRSSTCGLTAVEATQGKMQGKVNTQ